MGISNFETERIFNMVDIDDLNENFIGVFPFDKTNRFFDITKMKKWKSYPFLIVNTDRLDKTGTNWWSLLDIDEKKDFLLFDFFGVKGLRNFIIKDDETVLSKVLNGIENIEQDKTKLNLVNVNFSANSYCKLNDNEKTSLSDTANDFLHFIESFAKFEKQNLIHLWLVEDPIQNLETDSCGPFPTYFYKNLFFPNNDSALNDHDKLTYEAVQDLLNKLFMTDTKENERIICNYIELRNIKMVTT